MRNKAKKKIRKKNANFPLSDTINSCIFFSVSISLSFLFSFILVQTIHNFILFFFIFFFFFSFTLNKKTSALHLNFLMDSQNNSKAPRNSKIGFNHGFTVSRLFEWVEKLLNLLASVPKVNCSIMI